MLLPSKHCSVPIVTPSELNCVQAQHGRADVNLKASHFLPFVSERFRLQESHGVAAQLKQAGGAPAIPLVNFAFLTASATSNFSHVTQDVCFMCMREY